MNKKLTVLILSFIFFATSASAGSTHYLRANLVHNQVEKSIITTLLLNPDPDGDSGAYPSSTSDSFNDLEFAYGYKKRLGSQIYYSPEFILATHDLDQLTYGVGIKLGFELEDWSLYGSTGLIRFDKYETPATNIGLGIDYQISDRISLGLQWQNYQSLKHATESRGLVEGGNDLYTKVNNDEQINSFSLGLTFYWNE